MGFYNGLWALFIILSFSIDHCYNSKITFPTRSGDHNNGTPVDVEIDESPTKSSIVTATPTPSSTFSLDDSNSGDIVEPLVYSLFPAEQDINNSVIEIEREKIKSERKFLFPEDNSGDDGGVNNELAEVRQEYIRSLEISDSSENFNPDRKLRYEDDRDRDRKSSGWNFEENGKRWSSSPDEKTIALQVLDEDPYQHGRPAWPHDEYLVGYFDLKGSLGDSTRNTSNFEETSNTESIADEDIKKFYEWKRLQGNSPPPPSSFIGPGFYDVGSSSDYYGNSVSAPLSSSSSGDYYRFYQNQPSYQRITTGDSGKVQTISSNSEGSNGEGTVPGATSESSTNTRGLPAYAAYDFYKRKRLRLQIHPGLIAAPLAGLAAFGAASALTSKPLLVELGYVRNKPDHIIGGGGGGFPGGWGWAGTQGSGYRPYPPFYPPPNPPPHHYLPGVGTGSIGQGPIGGGFGGGPFGGGGFGGGGGGIAHAGAHGGALGGGPVYPVLKPIRSHKPDTVRSNWWNPFAGLTPRLTRIPRKRFKKF